MLIGLVCLISWVSWTTKNPSRSYVRLHSSRLVDRISSTTMAKLILAVSCLCRPSHASRHEVSSTTSSDCENWYLVGCIVVLFLALEGVRSWLPRRNSSSSSKFYIDASTQTNRGSVPVTTQTEGVDAPQVEEFLLTRTQQSQTIRALQGVIGKKNHDLHAIRNWRLTANAVGNICVRQRTNAGLVLRRPCAHCGDETVLMPQILQDMLYPTPSTGG